MVSDNHAYYMADPTPTHSACGGCGDQPSACAVSPAEIAEATAKIKTKALSVMSVDDFCKGVIVSVGDKVTRYQKHGLQDELVEGEVTSITIFYGCINIEIDGYDSYELKDFGTRIFLV